MFRISKKTKKGSVTWPDLKKYVRVAAPGILIPAVMASPVPHGAGSAAAQTPDTLSTHVEMSAEGSAPDVETLVGEALARSPNIASVGARVRAAQELVTAAGSLPNPMLDVMLQNIGTTWTVGREDMSMIGPAITQPIPFPGKRGARRDAARAEARVMTRELDAANREVARDVRLLYARLYSLDHEEHCLESGSELVEMLRATVNGRYSAGLGGQESALKVQLSQSRIAERLADLKSERQALVTAMNRLLDRPGSQPLGEVESLPAVVFPAPDSGGTWEIAVVENSPEVAAARARVKAAEANLKASRVELRPDLSARAGVGFRGSLDPVVTLGLGIELPIFNGQNKKPLVRSAESALEAARADLRSAEAAARAESARIAADLEKANAQVVRYDQALVPQTSLALDAARAGYVAGTGDFSTVIEDFNMWLDARAGQATREAERYMAWVELEALIHAPVAPE